jgi:Arc/MetJ-type ribon-helix-helix transcriptional regulator
MQKSPQARPRLSLDISEKARKTLDDLVERLDYASIAELVRRSVALLDMVSQHERDGGALILRHADGSEEKLKLL